VHGYRIAMTPDRLIGRTESVWSSIVLLLAPLGPLLASALFGAVFARVTIGVLAALSCVLSLWTSLRPAIRAAPTIGKFDAAGAS
jgi:hypothetical protein